MMTPLERFVAPALCAPLRDLLEKLGKVTADYRRAKTVFMKDLEGVADAQDEVMKVLGN